MRSCRAWWPVGRYSSFGATVISVDTGDPTNLGRATSGGARRVADVFIFDTRAGLAPHLVWSTTPGKTFCGLEPSRPSRTWFALAGCGKCRKSAVAAGIAMITDVDGEHVEL